MSIGRAVVLVSCLAANLITIFSGMVTARSTGADGARHVAVREDRGVYCVRAQFDVPQSAAVALMVLTDYEQIPRFMPDVKSSVVLERSEDRVVIDQEAVARVMLFSKRIYLRLEVRTSNGTIVFRDASGRSFIKYEGAWRVAEQDGRTVVRYELNAQPAFDLPAFLLRRLLKRDADQMIERLRAEIAARARPSSTP